MSRSNQQVIALVLLVLQGVFAAVIIAKPGTLGLPEVAVAWMAIANVAVGIFLNGLPTLWEQRP